MLTTRSIAIALMLLTALIADSWGQSHQTPSQAPQVQPKQQPERSSENQKQTPEQVGRSAPSATPLPQVGALVSERKCQCEADHSYEEGTEFWPPFLGYRLKVTDTLIAAFTAGLFVATWLLWRATNKLVAESKNTAQSQLRAYVAGRVNFIFAFNPDDHASAKFQIVNAGHTPAHSVAHHADIVVAPHPLPEGYEFAPLTTSLSPPIVVFPNLPFDGYVTGSKEITKADITRILTGSAKLYVYGEIFYDDVFGEGRTTNFAVAVDADHKTLTKLTSGYKPSDLVINFRSAAVGNSAT